jgi:hypothetical protein
MNLRTLLRSSHPTSIWEQRVEKLPEIDNGKCPWAHVNNTIHDLNEMSHFIRI